MKIVNDFIQGFFLPLKAARLLGANRNLWRYAIAPLLINFIIYALLVTISFYALYRWDWVNVHWKFWGSFGDWLTAAVNFADDLVKWIVMLPLIFFSVYYTFTFVGMVLASPLNDILSEKTENLLSGRTAVNLPLRLNLKIAMLSVLVSLEVVVKQAFFSLLALPFLIIPVVGVLPFFIVTAYYTGYGLLDVGMARNYFRRRHRLAGSRSLRWQYLGLGVAMELLFLIPFAGLFVLPLGIIGGTILYCRNDWHQVFAEKRLDTPEAF